MKILSSCCDKADLSMHNGTLFVDTWYRDNGDINEDGLMIRKVRYLQLFDYLHKSRVIFMQTNYSHDTWFIMIIRYYENSIISSILLASLD